MMPGMVLNTCNPSIWEAEAGGLGFVFVFVLLCFFGWDWGFTSGL
jgi:hypothetical protein